VGGKTDEYNGIDPGQKKWRVDPVRGLDPDVLGEGKWAAVGGNIWGRNARCTWGKKTTICLGKGMRISGCRPKKEKK